MSRRETARLPGYREFRGDRVEQIAPQILHHDGEPYLVVHSPCFTSGVIRPGNTTGEDDRVMLAIWGERPPGAPIAMALAFTPDAEMLDSIIDMLVTLRERQQATACMLATAALRKAADR